MVELWFKLCYREDIRKELRPDPQSIIIKECSLTLNLQVLNIPKFQDVSNTWMESFLTKVPQMTWKHPLLQGMIPKILKKKSLALTKNHSSHHFQRWSPAGTILTKDLHSAHRALIKREVSFSKLTTIMKRWRVNSALVRPLALRWWTCWTRPGQILWVLEHSVYKTKGHNHKKTPIMSNNRSRSLHLSLSTTCTRTCSRGLFE